MALNRDSWQVCNGRWEENEQKDKSQDNRNGLRGRHGGTDVETLIKSYQGGCLYLLDQTPRTHTYIHLTLGITKCNNLVNHIDLEKQHNGQLGIMCSQTETEIIGSEIISLNQSVSHVHDLETGNDAV